MTVMMCIGGCYTCGQLITFNPMKVPSVPAKLTTTGEKEPVCETCIERANPERIKRGLAPIVIHPNAYGCEPAECDALENEEW